MFAKVILAFCGLVASTVALAGLPTTKYVNVNGLNIAYYESTGTHGKGILYVPGNSTTAKSFEHVFDGLFAAYNRVVVMELPGTGNSAHDTVNPQTTYSVKGLAQVIAGVANALHLDQGVIAGWSAGGNALFQGEGLGLFPNAAGLLVYGAPPVKNPFDPSAFLPHPAGAYGFTPVLTSMQAQELADAFLRPGQTAPTFFRDDILNTDPNFRLYLGQSLFTGNYNDETQIVGNMTKPLAVLHGEDDQLINLSYIQAVTMPTLWDNQIKIVPSSGHAIQYNRPIIFNALVRSFYRDVTP